MIEPPSAFIIVSLCRVPDRTAYANGCGLMIITDYDRDTHIEARAADGMGFFSIQRTAPAIDTSFRSKTRASFRSRTSVEF